MNTTLYQNRPEDTQNWNKSIVLLEPHDCRIYYVNINNSILMMQIICIISMEFLLLSHRRSSA